MPAKGKRKMVHSASCEITYVENVYHNKARYVTTDNNATHNCILSSITIHLRYHQLCLTSISLAAT